MKGWMCICAYRCFSKTHLDWEVGDENQNEIWVRGMDGRRKKGRDALEILALAALTLHLAILCADASHLENR